MEEVGIRELKAQLSKYVARASAGEKIVVTDRGTPIAQLNPLESFSSIKQGIEEGWIIAPKKNRLQPCDRFQSGTSTLSILEEDRN